MHEIITIQVGRRANYLGAHYWNTQDSYQTFAPDPPSIVDHDVQFRQGLAPDGSTSYLPRALIYDLKSGFGSLAQTHVMGSSEVHDISSDTLWNGSLTRLPPIPQQQPSAYAHSLLAATEPVLPTTSTTAFFADFASTFYHPRSLIPITPPYPSNGQSVATEVTAFAASGTTDISDFQAGIELFRSRDSELDVLDSDIRPWLEECDGLQAVQVFTSSDDAWAGFSTEYVEHLRDELGKSCIWVWGIDESSIIHEPGRPRQTHSQKRAQALNTALFTSSLFEHASMFVPLAVPSRLPDSISLNSQSLWNTSALIESAMESSTLATRLKEIDGTRTTMRDWQDTLSEGGRRTIAHLSVEPGFEIPSIAEDVRMRKVESLENDESVAAVNSESSSLISLASKTLTGSSQATSRTYRKKTFSKIQSFRASQTTLDKVMQAYRPPPRGIIQETYSVPLSFPLLPTYPQIFSTGQDVSSKAIRVQTALETTSEVAIWLRSLQSMVRNSVGINVGGEEREVLYSNLGDMAEKYVEDWESADESEDDD